MSKFTAAALGVLFSLLAAAPVYAEGDGRSAIPDLYAAFECKNGRACPTGKPRPFGTVRIQSAQQPLNCEFYRKPSASLNATQRERLYNSCVMRSGARRPPT